MRPSSLNKGQARRFGVLWIFVGLLVLVHSAAFAVDIHPVVKQQLIEDGRWEHTKEIIRDARTAGMNGTAAAPGLAASAAGYPAGFAGRIPCILVEFSDNAWADGVNTSTLHMDSVLFSEGVYPTGSLRDYYLEASYAHYAPDGDVYGPVTLPQTYEHYIDGIMGISLDEPNSKTIFRDAVNAADALIDYADYDGDGNGFVDGVMLIIAGHGFEESGDSTKILSHQWELPLISMAYLDGVTLRSYTIQPEEHGPYTGGGHNGIGVYCHEWGHIFDLPDLYDEDGSSWGIGDWSIMGSGNYLNQSRTPAHFDPWCKVFLGWVDVDTVASNRVDEAIPSFATSPTVYRLWMGGLGGNEYFLVCNRQKDGFDSYLPGSGLMVLHVDEAVGNNNNQNEYIEGETSPIFHYRVAVIQADGNFDLERLASNNLGDQGDLYTDETIELDDLTYPSSHGYSGITTEVAVWNISAPGPVMTANLDVSFSRPLLQLFAHWFDDAAGGDNNGVPDPGESVNLMLTTTNIWKSTTDIDITVTCSDPDVHFTNGSSHIASLNQDEYYTNYPDPISFSITAGAQPAIADFYIHYSAEGGAFDFAETLRVDLGPKQVLIVDGDADYEEKDYYELYYGPTMENLRIPYDVHNIKTQGHPSAGKLGAYPMVCWYTGRRRATPLQPSDSLLVHGDIAALETYLDNGGRLFLTGQDIAQYVSQTADSLFLVDYLGARYDGSTSDPIFVTGINSDAVGLDTLVLMGQGGAANQSNSDNLAPVPSATISFHYSKMWPPQSELGIAGVTYAANDFKTVFWGFGFESVTAESGTPGFAVTREQTMGRVLFWLVQLATDVFEEDDFFAEEFAGNVPAQFTLAQNYPNPFNGRTVIEFTVAAGLPGQARVDVIDILGRKVKTVFEGPVEPGVHQVVWNGTDRNGRPVASGVYFYRIVGDRGVSETRRMVYLK